MEKGLVFTLVALFFFVTFAVPTRAQAIEPGLGLGSQGNAVTILQQTLKDEGFFTYPVITGFFGTITKQAVIAFQDAYANSVLAPLNLTRGTGYVGSLTAAALNAANQKSGSISMTFVASSTTITPGQSTTLSWTTSNATSCSASGGWSGSENLGGSLVLTPTSSTTYTLTCSNNKKSSSQSVVVSVTTTPPPPTPPTVSLSASPTSITAGGSSTLTWSSTNATSCTATNFLGSGTSGSVTVFPTTSTTYTITCTGTGGSATGSATTTIISGTPPLASGQLPNILSGYMTRPPWQVAGVDYPVGVPVGTTLKDPLTPGALPSCADTSDYTLYGRQFIRVSGSNCTINGFDFSLHGGLGLYITGSNITVTNSNFVSPTTTAYVIQEASPATGITIENNTIDGDGASGNADLIGINGGTAIVENNWLKNFPQHAVDINGTTNLTYSYNLVENGGMVAGSHLNYLQWGNGAGQSSAVVEYNTTYQQPQVAGGEGFQFDPFGTITFSSITVDHNTMIAVPSISGTPPVSYFVHGSTCSSSAVCGTGTPVSGLATFFDNYFDASGAYGTFYPQSVQNPPWTISGNVDMRTGQAINS